MAIFTTRYGTIFGKQIPTLHSPRGLGIGPASSAGRFVRLAKFAFKHRKAFTGAGSVGVGALLTPDGVDLIESGNNFSQTYRPRKSNLNSRAVNRQRAHNKIRSRTLCSKPSNHRCCC